MYFSSGLELGVSRIFSSLITMLDTFVHYKHRQKSPSMQPTTHYVKATG